MRNGTRTRNGQKHLLRTFALRTKKIVKDEILVSEEGFDRRINRNDVRKTFAHFPNAVHDGLHVPSDAVETAICVRKKPGIERKPRIVEKPFCERGVRSTRNLAKGKYLR